MTTKLLHPALISSMRSADNDMELQDINDVEESPLRCSMSGKAYCCQSSSQLLMSFQFPRPLLLSCVAVRSCRLRSTSRSCLDYVGQTSPMTARVRAVTRGHAEHSSCRGTLQHIALALPRTLAFCPRYTKSTSASILEECAAGSSKRPLPASRRRVQTRAFRCSRSAVRGLEK